MMREMGFVLALSPLPALAQGDPDYGAEAADPYATPAEPPKDEEDGRTEILFFGAEAGLGWVNLKAVEYDGLLPSVVDKSGSGPDLGLHALLRLYFIAVGVRAQVVQLTDFDVWHMNLEGQLRLPSEILDVVLRLGIGYAFLGTDFQGADPSINGWDGQLGFGIDFYLADWVTLGPTVDVTFLNLTRSDSLTELELTSEGSAAGIGVHAAAVLSLHL